MAYLLNMTKILKCLEQGSAITEVNHAKAPPLPKGFSNKVLKLIPDGRFPNDEHINNICKILLNNK